MIGVRREGAKTGDASGQRMTEGVETEYPAELTCTKCNGWLALASMLINGLCKQCLTTDVLDNG